MTAFRWVQRNFELTAYGFAAVAGLSLPGVIAICWGR